MIMKNIYSLIVFAALFSSCRFIPATNRETTALNEQGAYKSGAPAWAKLPKNEQVNLPANSGLIPETFGVPESVARTSEANASSSMSPYIGKGVEASQQAENKNQIKKNVKNSITGTESENLDNNSEIGKIEASCPGTESALVDAIKTENVSLRIKKYIALTKRCKSSPSIWIWLAKDYAGLGRINDAKKCARNALAIDQNNSEALSLLKELNES